MVALNSITQPKSITKIKPINLRVNQFNICFIDKTNEMFDKVKVLVDKKTCEGRSGCLSHVVKDVLNVVVFFQFFQELFHFFRLFGA